MKKNLLIALWFTLVTTVMFGVLYPLAITGLAQLFFPDRANGQLIQKNGKIVGSKIIGQSFTGPGYFHSRPSNAGAGYDATASSGSNLGPTNKALLERVKGDVQRLRAENPNAAIPIDLVTTSGSGLDPEIGACSSRTRHEGRRRTRVCAKAYKGEGLGISWGAARECSGSESRSRLRPSAAMKLRICGVTVVQRRRAEIGSGTPTKVRSKYTVGAMHLSRSCCAVDLSPRGDSRFPHGNPVPKRSAIFSYA